MNMGWTVTLILTATRSMHDIMIITLTLKGLSPVKFTNAKATFTDYPDLYIKILVE